MSETAEVLTRVIMDNGYRLTSARRVIIETLVTLEDHVSADELALEVRRAAPHVGRMTVYRTLDLLCELGVIRPIYQGDGAARYVLLEDGHHHHFICNRCHQVTELSECLASELIQQVSERLHFQVQSHLLELHGLCSGCFDTEEE